MSISDLPGVDQTRTALVTGRSTHIGRVIAQALADVGYLVYIASRDGARCAQVAEQISAGHGPCRSASVDVTSWSSVEILLDRIVEESSRLDVVVGNAGGRVPASGSEERHDAAVVELNLLGALVTGTAACRVMAGRGGGSIVLVSSVHGILGSDRRLYTEIANFTPSTAAYHSAKGGVIQLARSLAAEFGPVQVRVNSVSPGVIQGNNIPRELAERVADRTPLGRIGRAEDVASVVRFLVGADAAWITGQNVVVDGGWSIW